MNRELTELEYEQVLDTFRTASEWHGGMWSALYSYSSTGQVHGEEHKEDLLTEIEEAFSVCYRHGVTEEVVLLALDYLQRTIQAWPREAV